MTKETIIKDLNTISVDTVVMYKIREGVTIDKYVRIEVYNNFNALVPITIINLSEDNLKCLLKDLQNFNPLEITECGHEWVLESVGGLENSKCKKCNSIKI